MHVQELAVRIPAQCCCSRMMPSAPSDCMLSMFPASRENLHEPSRSLRMLPRLVQDGAMRQVLCCSVVSLVDQLSAAEALTALIKEIQVAITTYMRQSYFWAPLLGWQVANGNSPSEDFPLPPQDGTTSVVGR